MTALLETATRRLPWPKAQPLIEDVLLYIPKKFDVLPSLREINDLVEARIPSRSPKADIFGEKWVSVQCPGVHPCIEAMCSQLKNGEDRGLKLMLAFLGLTEEQAWKIYEKWLEGKMPEYKEPPSIRELFDFLSHSRTEDVPRPAAF